MSQEWYKYAISIKDRTEKIENMLIFNICTCVLLGIFSMAVFFINTVAFFILIVSYILLFIFNQKNKDIYAKNLFSIGIFIFYLSLDMIFMFAIIDLFKKCLLIILPLFAILYEIKVLIDIKQKRYSSPKSKLTNIIYVFLTLISGTTVGLRVGKFTGNALEDSPWLLVVAAIVTSLLFVCACMYLQKYMVYTLLKTKNESC